MSKTPLRSGMRTQYPAKEEDIKLSCITGGEFRLCSGIEQTDSVFACGVHRLDTSMLDV